MNEIMIYQSDDHKTRVEVRFEPKKLIEQQAETYSGFQISQKYLKLTAFGLMFAQACIHPPKAP